MIGIYQDNIIDYLKEHLGDSIKVTAKNIICPCPWCEVNKTKKHYHMYISLEDPIFHCFHSDCQKRGFISKLFMKINGIDVYDKIVDKEKVKESEKRKRITQNIIEPEFKITLPEINERQFSLKSQYMKKRLRDHEYPISKIKGLIFDVNSFISLNNIIVDERLFRIKDFLHSNFVGFLTEYKSIVIFRNIDSNSSFRHFKLRIRNNKFLDHYKIQENKLGNTIILSEGIFDILSEQINNKIKLKNETVLYAAGLSTSYDALIKSVVFYEQIFRPDIAILSDKDIDISYYRKLKKYNNHIINSLTVYYNKTGKDFANATVIPEKFII